MFDFDVLTVESNFFTRNIVFRLNNLVTCVFLKFLWQMFISLQTLADNLSAILD